MAVARGGQCESSSDRQVLRDTIEDFLLHKGHLQPNGRRLGGGDSMREELSKAVISLTNEYERQYAEQLDNLSKDWQISKNNPQGSFNEVLATIFQGGCNWGRVITIFVFISLFMRKCREQQLEVRPDQVASWSVDYMYRSVMPWIREHDGWRGLISFYRNGEVSGQSGEDGQSMMRLLTLAGASLALLGITSFLVNRA